MFCPGIPCGPPSPRYRPAAGLARMQVIPPKKGAQLVRGYTLCTYGCFIQTRKSNCSTTRHSSNTVVSSFTSAVYYRFLPLGPSQRCMIKLSRPRRVALLAGTTARGTSTSFHSGWLSVANIPAKSIWQGRRLVSFPHTLTRITQDPSWEARAHLGARTHHIRVC